MADKEGTLITNENENFYPRTKANLIEGMGEFANETISTLGVGNPFSLLAVEQDGTVGWVQPYDGETVIDSVSQGAMQAVTSNAVYVEKQRMIDITIPGLIRDAFSLKSATLIDSFTASSGLSSVMSKSSVSLQGITLVPSTGSQVVLICVYSHYNTPPQNNYSNIFVCLNASTSVTFDANSIWFYR